MKKRLYAVLAAAMLLTGCAQTSNSSSSENLTDTAVASENQSSDYSENPAEETSSKADTTTETEATKTTAEEEISVPEFPLTADDYYPAMPDADEAAMADEALKAEITDVIRHSYFMEMLKYGACYVEDEDFFGDSVPDAAPKGDGAYYEVKGVSDKEALLALFREAFTEKYLSQLDPPLEEQLFGDIAQLYTDEGEFVNVPYFKEMNGKLLAYYTYNGVPLKPRYDELVITSATADEVCVSVAGTSLSYDNWKIGEFVLIKDNGVWKTDSFAWRTANYMGKLLSKRLNSDNLSTLGKICGTVTQTSEQGTIINDCWYYPVEPFMTIEEMRGFLRENFTDEAAKLYEPYINCFVEQDGSLYRVWEGVSCPNPKSFGSYEPTRSLPLTSSFSNNVETSTSKIPWNDGFGNTTEVLVVLANGKIACELPCTFLNE
ncbi:MAG: hypothetical protein ACI4KM_06505 [Oscillospiraceae bacterium]